ncbi:DUF1622 domain-containing protein [Streptomyces sp. NBC_00080]|uniref:DUF1622 domain-containing protein n=1 Tax=Streptomyces sp. NBC_00080 TaxID=2975645 RepID=UPI00324C69B6
MKLEILPEPVLHDVVDLLVRLVECSGALVIAAGAVLAFAGFVVGTFKRSHSVAGSVSSPAGDFNRVRLRLGRYLALGLEFQLAGDILRTAVAPTFAQIGQLAAIAAIRTVLNYFLGKEIEHERKEVEQGAAARLSGAEVSP